MNVDVLVIGCGPAGASAAIAAHDAGASVLVAWPAITPPDPLMYLDSYVTISVH